MIKKVVIFKEYLLHASERFVLDQVENIKNFNVALIGLNKLKFIDLDSIRNICLEKYSKLQILSYKLFGIAPKLISIIKKEKPDIIHVHMGGDAARFTTIRKKFNSPVIATFHGTDATTTDEWKKKSELIYHRQYPGKRPRIIKEFDHFIAISNYVKSKMVEQGYPEEKITVHYMGINIDFFNPNKQTREKTVLFVGRLTKIKGCEYLIRAMSKVKEITPEANLIVIGDGSEASSLKELSTKLQINAKFLGVQNRDTIKGYLQKASVFCGPSITMESGGAEGLGIVFLEAQAMGTPVVSFSSGGIPEAVITNKTGFLYPEKDIAGLSLGITTLLTDAVLWNELSQNCVAHIQQNFDIQKQTTELENIYRRIINNYHKDITL